MYDLGVRARGAVALAIGLLGAPEASADPVVEVGVFGGARWFTKDSQLGNSMYADQVPRDAATSGLRLAFILPDLWTSASGESHLQLAIEAEGAFTPAFSGSSAGDMNTGPRRSVYSPIYGGRGHLALRFSKWDEVPHLLVGGGLEAIDSRSPYIEKESDWVVYYGLGVTIPLFSRVELRADIRHGIVQGREHDVTSTLEAQGAIQFAFGGTYRRPPIIEIVERDPDVVVTDEPDDPIPPPSDLDGDRIADAVDQCPNDRETVNNFEDTDGCPEEDSDGDKLWDSDDKCPGGPEDADGFEDADGCPDPDNDADGVDDIADQCPREGEVRNGFQDTDGCPDAIPVDVTKAFTLVATMKFEANRARVTEAGRATLRKVLATLDSYPDLKIVVTGHPDKSGNELAQKRADAVKWYLVDQGAVPTQIETNVGDVARQPVTMSLWVAPAP
jgi:outer membrane protein OmpA-like peptidoglycan-associated protein